MKKFKFLLIPMVALAGFLTFNSCKTGIPEGAEPVKNFQAEKYLGKWYEIARFDFRFERGLDNTTANYSLNPDGSIKVVNRGYKTAENEWKEAVGEARFLEGQSIGRLKVSFFKPFWGAYNILSIDGNYEYALVAGDNLKYLWILSREKTIPNEIREKYLNLAKKLGYQTENMIWPKHDR
ncbi:lipocalin family protein [Kaistella montana]|uniref:Lipocalin family protein n=1 Tax=Kaistella montana TaxID=1849733 RepID=A0ABW5K570_9FLAO|nr:lipocalin family protein [Kaistella montana]MCQ4034304.1 lipocalin family protein [Kaistella montana]